MYKYAIVAAFIVLLSATTRGQDFYDINTINEIEITFQESNWDQILDSYYAAGDEERLVGTAVVNGIQFDSVGVRYKGFSTYNPNQVKNPLNIKLDYIIDDQKYDGYGTLKLANSSHDPSFLRDVLSYEIARNYMPAGKANYMKVTINGTYIGLYVSVQDVDKYFARMHDYDDDGARFKGVLPDGAMSSQPSIWGYLGTDSTNYEVFFQHESDLASDWDELANFFYEFNYNSAGIETVLNVDRHLWKLAFEILLVNLDGPVNVGQNYYIFQDHDDRINPILWDLNMCFGGFTELRSTHQHLTTLQMQQLTPLLNLGNSDYPIINNILSDATYQRMYFAHMKTLIDENFQGDELENRGEEIQAVIAAEVQADPNKFNSYTDFINNLTSTVGQTVGITQLMDGRVSYLSGQSFYTSTPPTIADISYSPESIPAGSTVDFTADVSNANTVILGYRQSVYRKFEKVEMFDDGAHNDGAAGDGVYGVSVDIDNGDIQYYIYTENSNAGIFSPARAEYEYYTAPVIGFSPSTLAINEFMADNDNVVADQSGDYDDWIELYNMTGNTIELNGYYLTDDITDITQWTFPDTSIEPYGFLLIWADDDTEQEGLHANFKLSASGEVIILSSPSLETIDEITFDEQKTDTSYGRYPDGTDNWLFFSVPTPEASNAVSANQPPSIEWTSQLPESVTEEDSVYVASKVTDESGITSVQLVYRIESDSTVLTMNDDGNSNDSLAGDNIYGSVVPPQSNGVVVQYYVAATDDSGAVVFDPSDPSTQTHNYTVGLVDIPLYINEFMADNDNIVADQDSEYDDWIELYNKSDTAISLNGYYLTDDDTDPTQWVFPDTSIAAGGFLLIWADDDTEQEGLHANFKLGASGEQIVFSSPSQVIIDSITFGQQTTDVSYGRYPNGADNWVFFDAPTPGMSNVTSTCCGVYTGGYTGNTDCDSEGKRNLADITVLIDHVYLSKALLCSTQYPPDGCEAQGNTDGSEDGKVNLADITKLIDQVYLSKEETAPCQ